MSSFARALTARSLFGKYAKRAARELYNAPRTVYSAITGRDPDEIVDPARRLKRARLGDYRTPDNSLRPLSQPPSVAPPSYSQSVGSSTSVNSGRMPSAFPNSYWNRRYHATKHHGKRAARRFNKKFGFSRKRSRTLRRRTFGGFKRRFGRRFGRRSSRRGFYRTPSIKRRVLQSIIKPYIVGMHSYINTVNEVKAPVGGASFEFIAAINTNYVHRNVTTGVSAASVISTTGHIQNCFDISNNTSGENARAFNGDAVQVNAGKPINGTTINIDNMYFNLQSSFCMTKFKNNTNTDIFVEFYWVKPRRDYTLTPNVDVLVPDAGGVDQRVSIGAEDFVDGTTPAPSLAAGGNLLFSPYHDALWVKFWKITKRRKFLLQPGQQGQVMLKTHFKGIVNHRWLDQGLNCWRKASQLLMVKIHGTIADVGPAGGANTTTTGPAQLDVINHYHYKFNRVPNTQIGNSLYTTYATLTHPAANTLSIACPAIQSVTSTPGVPVFPTAATTG